MGVLAEMSFAVVLPAGLLLGIGLPVAIGALLVVPRTLATVPPW